MDPRDQYQEMPPPQMPSFTVPPPPPFEEPPENKSVPTVDQPQTNTKMVSDRWQIDKIEKLLRQRDSAFKRFPLVFTLLGTFGLVSTLYGAQHLIDQIPVLAHNPLLTLGAGLLILLFTGTLYKKLG